MTTRRARSGRPRCAEGLADPWRHVARIAEQGHALGHGWRLAEEAIELRPEAVEHVPFRRGEVGPSCEIADVAWGHAEGVGHDLGEVARALAVQDARGRRGQEPVGAVVEAERRPDEEQLRERVRVEGEGHLGWDGLGEGGPDAGTGGGDQGRRYGGQDALGELQPVGRLPRSRPVGVPSGGSSRRAGSAGSTLEPVRRWANGLRSLPTPIRPSAQACNGVVPRPENGSRTTSPGRV